MRTLIRLGLACAIATIWIPWTEAEACSCAFGATAIAPGNGAVDVPLNAEVKIRTSHPSAAERVLQNLAFAEESGAAVEFTSTVTANLVRLRPSQQLRENTRYVIATGNLEEVVFQTGSTVDEVAPVNGTLSEFERVDERSPFFTSTCSPAHGYRGELGEGVDDRTAASDLWYLVYLEGNSEGPRVPASVVTPGPTFIGSGACSTGIVEDPPAGTRFLFAAVDLAGNEAADTEDLTLGGCGCAAGSSGSGASAIAALGFVLFTARRRRHQVASRA